MEEKEEEQRYGGTEGDEGRDTVEQRERRVKTRWNRGRGGVETSVTEGEEGIGTVEQKEEGQRYGGTDGE